MIQPAVDRLGRESQTRQLRVVFFHLRVKARQLHETGQWLRTQYGAHPAALPLQQREAAS